MKKLTNAPQKIFYASGAMGVNLLNTMMGSYICSALLVGGFGEEAIPFQTYVGKDLIIPAVWAVFAFLAKVVDGIIDIPMASFADNFKSRFGRRRPVILIGFIIMVLAYLGMLFIPNPNGATMINTVYFGIVLCIFYSFYTLTMVTYYSTYTEIVDTDIDRAFLSNVKAVCDIFYFIIGYVIVRMFLNSMNIRLVALIVLPLSLLMMIPVALIKEESNLGDDSKVKSVSLIQSLKCTFQNKPFLRWIVAYAFMNFGVQLFLGGINEYFSKVGMNMMIVMMSCFAPVPFTLILYNVIMKKKGFGFSFIYALAVYSVGMICMFVVGTMPAGTGKLVASIVAGVISSFAIGALFAVAYQLPSQLAAEEETRTGVANSAMYFAVQGLFSGIATGIATGIVLTALKGSESANSDAIRYITLISAAGTVVAGILTLMLPDVIKKIGKQDK